MFMLRRDGDAERGPIAMADLVAMAASGQVASTDLVREVSSPTWRMAGELPDLRPAFMGEAGHAPPRPPSPPPPPGAAAVGLGPADPPAPLRKADVGVVILLSVVTIGIYGLVWFYGAMRSYRWVAARPGSSSDTLFWAYVSCCIAALVLSVIYIGFLIGIAAIVVGALLLSNVLTDRETTCSRIGGVPGLRTTGFHLGLWLAAEICSATCFGMIAGIPLAIVQAVLFLQDHNLIVDEFLRRDPTKVAAS